MKSSVVDAQSFLAVEIGSVNTRLLLFDVVNGQYHFIAASSAASTYMAPWNDSYQGVATALKKMQEVTGRSMIDGQNQLMLADASNPTGVDRLAITFSTGPELHVITAGLLSDVSLDSANRLAATSYGNVIESIGLNDRRKPQVQLDAILRAEPDLIILAGGADRGATRSVLRLAELIFLTCQMIPQAKRPEVIYAGNQVLAKRIKEGLEKVTTTHIAPNIRPSIDLEDVGPAQEILSKVIGRLRVRHLGGLARLSSLTSLAPIPSAHAFGRMIRFLSQINDPSKAVLGIDLGANSTVMAVGEQGRLNLNVFPIGMGAGLAAALQQIPVEEIVRWLPMHIHPDEVRDYLWQKSLYPGSMPATSETLAIEHAAARQLLRMGMQTLYNRRPNMNRFFEPILVSGATLTQSPKPGQALMMLLDGLQPVGVTILELDQYGLLPALGATAEANALLPIQVLESTAFVNLATVISPISNARYGTPIMAVQLEYEDGTESRLEVKQGTLTPLPVYQGQVARIHLKPLRHVDLDPRWSGGGGFKIIGGVCGAVIDARGRPLVLPTDDARRRDQIKRWASMVGG